LSSYGGELAFDIQHSCPGPLSTEPLIVIKGNRMTLVHHHRNGGRLPAGRTERITIDTYESNYEHEDGRPASREDLMMVLADLESFLIRASHCDAKDEILGLADLEFAKGTVILLYFRFFFVFLMVSCRLISNASGSLNVTPKTFKFDELLFLFQLTCSYYEESAMRWGCWHVVRLEQWADQAGSCVCVVYLIVSVFKKVCVLHTYFYGMRL
uniref:Laminin IV type A domain-containing protein n=1 Tax=Toxocara canis TaxID=6265 RepID=A0A183TY65_TOXCA